MEAPPGQWSCPATVCYDGLSASAPSGRKTADSEPFTVPGWSQLTEDFTILRSHGPFFLEIFAGQAGITEAVQLMGVPALPPVDVVVSDLVSEAGRCVGSCSVGDYHGNHCCQAGLLAPLWHPVQHLHCSSQR